MINRAAAEHFAGPFGFAPVAPVAPVAPTRKPLPNLAVKPNCVKAIALLAPPTVSVPYGPVDATPSAPVKCLTVPYSGSRSHDKAALLLLPHLARLFAAYTPSSNTEDRTAVRRAAEIRRLATH